MAFRHECEKIATYDPAWGPIEHIVCAAYHSSVAFCCGGPNFGEQNFRWYFQGKNVATSFWTQSGHAALSPDGSKLAVGMAGRDDGCIFINGERAYPARFDTIYKIEWLDSQTLVWQGWKKRRGSVHIDSMHVFRNGIEVTGNLDINTYVTGGSRMLHGVLVCDFEKNVWWDVVEGEATEPQPLPPGVREVSTFDRYKFRTTSDIPKKESPNVVCEGKFQSVVYRGSTGGKFHEIEPDGGIGTYEYNSDQSLVAYMGVQYGRLPVAVERMAGRFFEWGDEIKRGRSIVTLILLPIALLYSPYSPFALGRLWRMFSKRCYPATQKYQWEQGYRWAGGQFFTPTNQLVVTASKGVRKSLVVIDQEEGPCFDEICQVRYCNKEGCVSYVARREHNFYRVNVL